jgi:hypothetical protein
MASKTVTIKDVAVACGCSIATVSYVLNDKQGHTISEKMRKKVLHTANYLNYVPNKSARTLVTNRFYNMTFCASPSVRLFDCAANARLIDSLSKLLRLHGYGLLYQNCDLTEPSGHTDVIFCVGLSKETFFSLGDLNFIPMIAVNMYVDDPLFYQVNVDYIGLQKRADAFFQGKPYIYCALPNENVQREQLIKSTFPHTRFLSTMKDLEALHGERVLLSDSVLAQEMMVGGGEVYYDPIFDQSLLGTLYTCATKALSREQVEDKGHFIVL